MWVFTVNRATLDCHSWIFFSESLSIDFISTIASIICSWTIVDLFSYSCLIWSSNLSNSSSAIAFPFIIGIIYIPFCEDLTWNPYSEDFLFNFSIKTLLLSSNSCFIIFFSFSNSSLLKVVLISTLISVINLFIVSWKSFPFPAGKETAIGSFGLSKL